MSHFLKNPASVCCPLFLDLSTVLADFEDATDGPFFEALEVDGFLSSIMDAFVVVGGLRSLSDSSRPEGLAFPLDEDFLEDPASIEPFPSSTSEADSKDE